MRRLAARLFGRRLQPVLIACFALVAALTVSLSAGATLRVITDYLDEAMDRRVDRDMDLARAFYQLKQEEVAAISRQLALDSRVGANLAAAGQEDPTALRILEETIDYQIDPALREATHLVLVFDEAGDMVAGRVLLPTGAWSSLYTAGNWANLAVLARTLNTGEAQAATEVIPAELLAQIGLADQAYIPLLETTLAAPELFDPREGTAGLALTGVHPLVVEDGRVTGAVLAGYLFNNDFTLVDEIKDVAKVDTATVFFGDLRVSTNVMTEAGERAVGTRVSQDVFDVVLRQGLDYIGRAFVVNDWFITRYEPLRDHLGQVVGSLYVGARESTFQALVKSFSQQVALIALVCMVLAGIVAIPIARLITLPISALVEANRQLAEGDMTVQVEPYGQGELAMLGQSFNTMAATLDQTQRELLHKERLASMGQLAAGVAHEINNPLATILLFSEALAREPGLTEQQREDLRLIVEQTIRCKHIVADLLNFARQQEVLAQETDVQCLLEQIIDLVGPLPAFAEISFNRAYDPDLPVIQADPAQLEQVFVNLFQNAAEAMDGRGTISLATRAVDGRCVEIQIADTGVGIPEENLGKLFTPFFTTKALGKGTGLGLAIVYGIIKMHKGQITVQSRVGEGTTFTITLPITLAGGQPVTIGAPDGNVAGLVIGDKDGRYG